MTMAQHSKAITPDPSDQADPVANALLDLIECQNVLQGAFDSYATDGDNDGTNAAIDAALDARAIAIMKLVAAQRRHQA